MLRWRSRLAIRTRAIDHRQTIVLAEQTCLEFYDAAYLWLARDLGAVLVTLDRRLNQAAETFR